MGNGFITVRTEREAARRDRRTAIISCSVGTAFEWYDFFIYASLAPFFATLFFPGDNRSAALLSTFAAYAAGFLVRPFGGLLFGRMGDRIGRKYTFLITVMVMGGSTFATGCLPTFNKIGIAAPAMLVFMRLMQGLALGGEYGGAVTYVAEHFPRARRGYATSWVQTTATVGLIMSLLVILVCRESMSEAQFIAFGWRIPFIASSLLLFWSLMIRMRLRESPVFERLLRQDRVCPNPLQTAFGPGLYRRKVFLAIWGACAGQGVVWYASQYYALFFMVNTLHVPETEAFLLLGAALLSALPLFVLFGTMSDRYGRLRFIVIGCALAALLYIPLFHGLARAVNPDLVAWKQTHAIRVAADDCHFHVFVGPWSKFTACDRVTGYLANLGLDFTISPPAPPMDVLVIIGDESIAGYLPQSIDTVLRESGYPASADPAKIDRPTAYVMLLLMMVLVTMVYGPMAAFLVARFPANIRYTAISLPYHIGNGWFGGVLPLMAAALVTSSGDIYAGLYYPVAVAGTSAVVGAVMLWDRRRMRLRGR